MPVIRSMIPWTEKIYDMSEKEIEDYIHTFEEQYYTNEETKKDNRDVSRIFYIEYQYYQLRKSHEWVEEQLKLTGDRMAVRREILMQRLRGSTESPIEAEDLEYLIQHMQKGVNDILLNKKWRMLTYPHGIGQRTNYIAPGVRNPFDERIPYIVSIDPAGGGGGDNTSITVINPRNLKVAAEFKSPYISGTELIRVLIDLITNYIPKGILFPEKNSMGIYLIHGLCETSIKKNLYWSQSAKELEDATEDDGPDSELKRLSIQYKKYGIYTSAKKRNAMFEILFRHINEYKEIINTEYLVDDICKLIRTSTGKIEAVKGEHDDCVMSYLIGCYLFYYGDNLKYFGIDNSVHPIVGVLDESLEKLEEQHYIDTAAMLSPKKPTWDDMVRDSGIEVDQMIKYAVTRESGLYKSSNFQNGFDQNEDVDIPASFFDQMNDW